MSARRHSSSTPRLRPYSQPTAPRPSGSTASDFDRVSVHFPGVHGAVRHPDWRYRAARPWPTIRIFPSATSSWINPVHLPPGEPGDAPHIGVRERLPGALGSPPDHTFDSRPRRLPLAGRHGASAPRRRQPRQGSEFERPPGLVVPAPFQIAVVLLHAREDPLHRSGRALTPPGQLGRVGLPRGQEQVVQHEQLVHAERHAALRRLVGHERAERR